MLDGKFRAALTHVYLENPCQVLPNALWKTLPELDDVRTAVEVASDGMVKRLEASTDDRLYIYWTREGRRPSLLMRRRLNTVRSALVHQDYLDPDTAAGFQTRLSFFRLIYRGSPPTPQLPAGYSFADVQHGEQAQLIADFIAECYDDVKPTADTVRQWTQRTVFAPDLWLWVRDERTGTACALAIAEFDASIGEVSLEWVQTLPGYQGKGLGRAVVQEILRRAAGRMAFATVSGQVEDRSNPGAFYRQCGFTGNDVWWLLAEQMSL
ncbi:MAG: GNAT family N-acetyltransferase [Chloroflexi bacterium]|nr:GNAT family N-acetyltransferase [Chloroflexota bacterium]